MASSVPISYHGRLSRGQGLAAPAPGHGRLPGSRSAISVENYSGRLASSIRQTRGSLNDILRISEVVGRSTSNRERRMNSKSGRIRRGGWRCGRGTDVGAGSGAPVLPMLTGCPKKCTTFVLFIVSIVSNTASSDQHQKMASFMEIYWHYL